MGGKDQGPARPVGVILALVSGDTAALVLGVTVALLLRYAVGGWPGGPHFTLGALALIALLPALSLLLLAASGLYRLDELFSGHREFQQAVHACTYAAFAVLILSFLLDTGVARGALLLAWAYSCLFVGLHRLIFRRVVARLRQSGQLVRRALIVGTDEHAVAIAHQLAGRDAGWQLLGFLDDYRPVGTEVAGGLQVVGDPASAARLVRELGASDLIIVPHAVSWEAQRDLLEWAAVMDEPVIRLAPGFYHLLATGARPMDTNLVPLLTVERLRITGLDAALKTVLDYSVALATLPLVVGLLAVCWLTAGLTGKGSVILRQRALGLRGRPFQLLMLARPWEPEPPSGLRRQVWHLRGAIAGSRLGKLPNVLNILAGRMSLVGPRALVAHDEVLQQPWARTLLLVRPGLTGPRLEVADGWALEEQAVCDVAYVREYSLWLDLRLLFASLLRTLRRERALPASYHPSPTEEVLPAETAAR